MSSPPIIEVATFLDTAVREGMLTAEAAKELKPKLRGKDPAATCVELGSLTAIQSEAIEGLLRPDSIAEGFKITGLLGYGGIGVVYKALQPDLDRVVAIKTIAADRLGASAAAARFKQEAQAVAKLKHPSIVTAYDYGRCIGDVGDSRFYLAMELVEGADLDHHVRKNGTLDEYHTWHVVQQVAAALAHAQDAGIVHRDIKPANLLLTDPPAGYPLPAGVPLVKVTDFGLVQLRTGAAEPATRLTVSGATMGTPNYMAPEQIDDAKVDHLADIYALGATAFHMLIGRPPYAGQSLMKVVTSKLTGDTEPLDSLPGDLTLATRELLSDMMSHDPSARPQTYAELLNRVARVLDGKGTDSRIVMQPLGATTSFSNTPSLQNAETIVSNASIFRHPTRRGLLLGLAAIGAASAGGLWWMLSQQEPMALWTAGLPRRPVPREFGFGPTDWAIASGTQDEVLQSEGNSPFLGYNRFDGAIRWRLPLSPQWTDIQSPEHFGVSLRIALGNAESLTVSLAWGDDAKDALVVHLGRDHTRVGRGAALSPPLPYQSADDQREMTLELHRDETHWLAYRSDKRTDQIGAVRFRNAGPPSKVRLEVEGGTAYLGEVWLYALEKRGG